MFVVDKGNESGVLYVGRNVEKWDGSVENNAEEFEARVRENNLAVQGRVRPRRYSRQYNDRIVRELD